MNKAIQVTAWEHRCERCRHVWTTTERTSGQLPRVQLSVLEQETRETVLKTPMSSASAGQDWSMDMNMNKAEGRTSARTEERAQVLQGNKKSLRRNKVPSAEQSPFGGTKSLRRNKVPSAEQSPFGGTKSLRRNKVPSAEQSPFGGTKSLRRNKVPSAEQIRFWGRPPCFRGHRQALSTYWHPLVWGQPWDPAQDGRRDGRSDIFGSAVQL